MTPEPAGAPLAALRRIARSRPAPAAAEERCDMCAAPIGGGHSHVVDVRSRAMMCACRPCYLLFIDEHATLHYRAVPDRYLSFPDVDERAWAELQIPVGLAFLFDNSQLGRIVAFYPGPAGATESELPLSADEELRARHPGLSMLRPDVEALLIRRPAGPGFRPASGDGACYLVPIDVCYELVGRLRTGWRGFDGGEQAREAIDAFFDRVGARSKPAS